MVNSSTVVHAVSFGMFLSGAFLALNGASTVVADCLMLVGMTTDVTWSLYWSCAASLRKL